MTHKLVIFDMDGVLIDSEVFYREINLQLFDKLGVAITEDEYNSFVGIGSPRMWQYVKEKGKLSQSIEKLIQQEKETTHRYLSEKPLEPMQGIPALLEVLQQKDYRIALASSSSRKNIELIIQKIKISQYFDFIVSGEEVQNGKPAPDIFQKAAAHFDIPAENCYVIEDSHNGMRGAKAAGMYCIGLQNPNSGNQDLSACDLVVESFEGEDLRKIFALLEK